tara:strand:- start:886 stop:1377 length:492 start_codon:yes stop_codon:yes gene_type:complete
MSWIVANFKNKELDLFKSELKKKLNHSVNFYQPKITIEDSGNSKSKFLLGNYLFCQSKFFDNNSIINKLRFIKGLNYFLNGGKSDKNEIKEFVEKCKQNEDYNGNLKIKFLTTSLKKNYHFISGPLKGLIFKIISDKKNKIELLTNNNRKVSLKKDSCHLFLA